MLVTCEGLMLRGSKQDVEEVLAEWQDGLLCFRACTMGSCDVENLRCLRQVAVER